MSVSTNRKAWIGVASAVRAAGLLVVLTAGLGCSDMNGNLLSPAARGGERWTIRCFRSTAPGHAETCNHLAKLLGNVQGLKSSAVRVETGAFDSTVYYGEYTKVPSPRGTGLTFPPEMERDQALIQQLTPDGRQRPFALAMPERIEVRRGDEPVQWQVSRAEGTHTLEIAVFYNTPTFNERQRAAEQYVESLRKDGFKAYYLHEPVKSRVFVGDFVKSDIIPTPDGRWQYGPRVLELINRRPEEFRYHTENGYRRKIMDDSGQMQYIPAPVVPVPRAAVESEW
jgi:hypothetical protein